MENRAGVFQQRNKRYCFVEYVNILNRGTEL